ncbi:orotidine 5'-phosphate decarboxylase, partial [Cutibacterium acnes subsp. acnes]|nr:orotidine 5'-phosphate decarboxylase [Cutibacterium acnes subsp. acnes]
AITQLTSTSPEALKTEQLVDVPLVESVRNYAKLAQAAGLAGVVCSAHEAADIASVTGPNFLRVTPGIRPAGSAIGDQSRVATPSNAASMGSSAIVVG